jgi:hypothetical protein
MLLIKIVANDGASHCIFMPSSIAIWYGKNRRKLNGGPYGIPAQPDIFPDDWDGSRGLLITDMDAIQTGDELRFISTTADGRHIKITLSPPCHALLAHYVAEYWRQLIEIEGCGPAVTA